MMAREIDVIGEEIFCPFVPRAESPICLGGG